MAFYRRFLFVLTLFILILTSCTRPVLIGSDFLEDEKASLNFKDDFTLSFLTEKTDSITVHSDNVSRQLVTYICGEVNDPIFGKSVAEIYVQAILPTVATELMESTLDSVVLLLRYDTLGNYGSLGEPVTLEVYRMDENPEFNEDYYSDKRFKVRPELLGSLIFIPRPKDSVTVYGQDDTLRVAPHIRIPLQKELFSDLPLQDSIVFQHLDSFFNYFNGLYIKMTNATNTMLGINLVNSVSGLSVFYTKGDVTGEEFRFAFGTGGVKTVYMEHDYTGSPVGAALSPEPENDYFYIQGLSGVTTKMSIEGLSNLGNVIINQVELEFYCGFPDGDIPEFYPPCPFIVSQYATDTSIVNSLDVTVALFRSTGNYRSSIYETLFGGVLDQVDEGPPAVYKYNMKITSQVKDILEGKKENIIYFNPIDKGNVPGRSVIYGPLDPVYAPRLKVYYTAL